MVIRHSATDVAATVRTKRRGAAAVEFAIVGSIFFMVIFAIFEFARSFMVIALLNDAALHGCRVGILPGKKNSDVTTSVQTFTNNCGVPATIPPTIQVNGVAGTVETANQYDNVTVTVSVPVSSASWLPFSIWVTSSSLNGTCTLRHE